VRKTATVWRYFDDVVKDAGETIKQQVHQRHGIAAAPRADPAVVVAALAQAEHDRAATPAARSRAADEATEAQLLFDFADRREREAKEWA